MLYLIDCTPLYNLYTYCADFVFDLIATIASWFFGLIDGANYYALFFVQYLSKIIHCVQGGC